jgi:hypothetical protein
MASQKIMKRKGRKSMRSDPDKERKREGKQPRRPRLIFFPAKQENN